MLDLTTPSNKVKQQEYVKAFHRKQSIVRGVLLRSSVLIDLLHLLINAEFFERSSTVTEQNRIEKGKGSLVSQDLLKTLSFVRYDNIKTEGFGKAQSCSASSSKG